MSAGERVSDFVLETWCRDDEYEQVRQIAIELRERRAADAWISVSERLPEDESEQVLVYAKDYGFGTDQCDQTQGPCAWTNFGEDVTHWKPLPEPPKGTEP